MKVKLVGHIRAWVLRPMVGFVFWLGLVPSAAGLEYPLPGQLVADCGDDSEEYLSEDQGSGIREFGPPRMFQHGRFASHSDYFTYTFPLESDNKEFWLAFEEQGECLVTVDGVTVLDEGNAGYGRLTARQFRLADPSLWADGKVEVTFRDAAPDDGGGACILWIECGPTTRFRERLRHVTWDTTGIVWSLGLWDGTNHEFTGDAWSLRVGDAADAELTGSGTWRVEWWQEIDPAKRYVLILGYLRGSGGIDMQDDGLWETKTEIGGEEALDLDVTDQLHPIDNVAALYAPSGFDYAALIEVTPGAVGPDDLRVWFGGAEAAENFSRVVENSWFWLLEMHWDATGFIDASPINGRWFQQYWPIDQATAFRELAHWGYLVPAKATARFLARLGWGGHESNRSGGNDNTAGNFIVMDMVSLLERTGWEPSLLSDLWPRIREHCEGLCQGAAASPFGLVKGTNWENAGNREHGPCFALSTNSGAAYALLQAALAAERVGEATLAGEWRTRAAAVRRAMLDHLVFLEDSPLEGSVVFPRGSWRYGLEDDGGHLRNPLAGWLWGASIGSSAYGLRNPDPELAAVDARTLDFAADLRWTPGIPSVAGYSVSLDGEDAMLLAAALADRPALMGKLIEEILKQCDYAEDVGAAVCELSRWALGAPGGAEDTNLVGAGFFLACARFLAGVDDVLHNEGQLRVIPRLPWGWTECRVNGWPVRYRSADGEGRTELNYHLRRGEGFAEMTISTKETVEEVRVRLGPFPSGAEFSGARVDGVPVTVQGEELGEAAWGWVSLDTGEETRSVRVELSTERAN